jgi:tetratricopeptide (TPR) repeat protein
MLGGGDAGEDPLSALVAAEVCVRHRESRFLGEDEFAFRHALVREGAYASLTTEDRALGHRLAGEWLVQAGEADPLILAAHFERGGIPERAGEFFLRGAEQANARRSYEEAEGFYARADALLGGLSASDRRSRGLARFRRGHHESALLELDAACVQAEALGDALMVVETLLDEAMVRDWAGDYRGAEERVLSAKARHVHWGSPLVDARLLLGLGRSSLRAGREQDAVEMLARAVASAAPLGDAGYETHVISLLLLGFVLPGIGRLDQAAEALDEVIQACEARCDFLHLAAALSNRALVRTFRGDREGMIADCERSIALGRELGQPRLELIAHYNLGEALYLMDDLPAAEVHVRAALAVTERPNAGVHRVVVDLLDARLRMHRGDEAEALSLVTSIRRAQLGERAKGVEILSPSEDVLCSMIELAVVDGSDEAWDALEARSSACSVGQERIEVIESRARAAYRQGRRVSAARHFERAIELASRVPNVMGPRLRRALAEI